MDATEYKAWVSSSLQSVHFYAGFLETLSS